MDIQIESIALLYNKGKELDFIMKMYRSNIKGITIKNVFLNTNDKNDDSVYLEIMHRNTIKKVIVNPNYYIGINKLDIKTIHKNSIYIKAFLNIYRNPIKIS